ncbi:small GTPase [Naegleria gruberi]|uniref:Small GTPase n=1 Tax=Naegleria gruberi TaxID=5762 RepID=D2W1S0_NAEGR|nr:small GTPase [Naegleria gruberi]EFC36968.1 small GTPase [Naegleria gruberi]|eukprot:XP_002669712.1 small GTPase [Naegleria gruberi]
MYLDCISIIQEFKKFDERCCCSEEAGKLALSSDFRKLYFEQMREYYLRSDMNEQALVERIEELESNRKSSSTTVFREYHELLKDYPNIKSNDLYVKFMVVGSSCGKTSFLYHLSLGLHPPYSNVASNLQYLPSIHDGYSTNLIFGSSFCNIGFWDTSGKSEYKTLRPLSYPGTDVCFLCFDCMSYDSLDLAINTFLEELTSHMKQEGKTFPIALLSTKHDLQQDRKEVLKLLISKQQKPINSQLGERIAKAIGCVTYLESILLPSKDYFKIIFNISRIEKLPVTTEKQSLLQKLGRFFKK